MKSWVYLGKEQIDMREIPVPTVGPRDVLIRNVYSSICGTDVAVYMQGPDMEHKVSIGADFGHETISRVSAVGADVTDFHIGQRVYPYPLFARDDTSKAGNIGAFSEYILCPNAKPCHSLYPVPDSIPDRKGCLIEPFTIGCRAARQSHPAARETAVIFGCGTIGTASAIALKWFGADKVMLCDISGLRLGIAERLEFSVCNVAEENFQEKAEGFFGRAYSLNGSVANVDIWIDAAGRPDIFKLFIDHGKIGSRFVSVAVNNEPLVLDRLQLTYSSKSFIGSGGYMPEDVKDVMEIMQSGRWDIESIITHEFPIDKLEEAIRTAAMPEQVFNVVIRFDEEI